MTTSQSRDLGWMGIGAEYDGARLRELLTGIMRRLDALDRNAASLSIPAGAITTAMLANAAVTAIKIADGAVTLAKMADGLFTADATGRAKFSAGFVNTALLLDGLLTADATGRAKMADAFVTKTKLAGSFLGATCIAGGAAGNHTVTGIATADQLVLVARLDRDAVAANINLTAITGEFTISAADTINNAAGTDTTGDALLVIYIDLT